MKVFTDVSLYDFEFWSGAKDTAEVLDTDDFNTIEAILEEQYPDGIDDGQLNDLFWHESDTIAEWLGYDDWEDLEKDRNGEEDEDDEDEEDAA
jgi:hypothetical protein